MYLYAFWGLIKRYMAKSVTDPKNTVNQSAQMISSQLQGVESSLLGAFIAVVAAAFVSNALGVIQYWAPASFILLWVIMANSFVRSYVPPFLKKRDRQEWGLGNWMVAVSRFQESLKEFLSERNAFIFVTRCKNLVPILRAIGIIFFICFISLVVLARGTAGACGGTCLPIPVVASLFLIFLPVFWHLALPKLEKSDVKTALTKIGRVGRSTLLKMLLGLAFMVLFTFFATLVLPIWSLVRLLPMYEYNLSALGSWLIVLVLVAVTALTLINYFSASTVKKEMTITLYNLANILNRISMNEVALGQTISEELLYDELARDYAKAKRYEISADDTLMINFYSLVPNKTYLSTIDQQPEPTSEPPA